MDTNTEEIAQELEDLKGEMRELIENAQRLLRGVNPTVAERARRTWLAHIETALDDDHEWLGRGGMTMQDTINELRADGDDEDHDEEDL